MESPRRPIADLVRRAGRRLPAPVRDRLRRPAAQPTAAPAEPPPPTLSVLLEPRVAVTDLARCLGELTGQRWRELEVVVVDDRTDPDRAEVLAAAQRTDARVRVVAPTAADPLTAGVTAARGCYLAFADPAASVPAGAYRALVTSLDRTGSDLAAGTVELAPARTPGSAARPDPARRSPDRPRTDLASSPDALLDLDPAGRVYRRSLLDLVLEEPLGRRTPALVAVAATLRAGAIDLLGTPTLVRAAAPARRRPARPGTRIEGFLDHLDELAAARRLVAGGAPSTLASAWWVGRVDGELGDDIAAAVEAAEADRAGLAALARTWLETAPEDGPAEVRVDRKLRLWLAAEERWAELVQVIDHVSRYGAIPPTTVEDGQVVARLPASAGLLEPAPPREVLTLSTAQTALSGCVQTLHWEGAVLVVRGWAFNRGVDLAGVEPELTAVLDGGEQGRRPVAASPRPTTAANRWSRFRYQDVAPGGFELRVDTTTLTPAGAATPSGSWRLRLTCSARGVTRTGTLTSVVGTGIGQRMPARDCLDPDDPVRVVPLMDGEAGLTLQVRRDRVRATHLEVGPDGATGRLQALDPALPPLVAVTATARPDTVRAELVSSDDGLAFTLPVPPSGSGRAWVVRVVDEAGVGHRVSWPPEAVVGRAVGGGPGGTRWRRSPRGFCDLGTGVALLEAVAVTVGATELTLDLRSTSDRAPTEDELATAVLHSRTTRVPVARVSRWTDPTGTTHPRLVFPLAVARWGRPSAPLPSGDYGVRWADLDVTVDDDLLTRCPVEGRTSTHRYAVGRRPGSTRLLLGLAAPLADDEVGRYAQEQLAQEYQAADPDPVEAVLLSSYRGDFATDSQRALHAELRAQQRPLRLLWGVTDHSVVLPEGGEPVLVGSRAWFTALASARYLCQNIDFERYFRPRPHQRYLQTFHGYPFKSMGASLWRSQGRYEAVVQAEQRRRSGAWDAIVVPAEFCVELYRREYGFAGRALVTGYPRDDELVRADPMAGRSRVLAQLGVDPGTTVVLYAPTWRDTAATSAWTAELFDALDLDALLDQLGPGFTVLHRGHNYNLRGGHLARSARVLDVSDHPEVNDLVLAADVAVLDYSSLRFDWMLTGKPVLFFVPDLEEYLTSRSALYDYAPTAPGPLLSTTAELGAALLELDVVAGRYASARQIFNERYNRLHDGHATERLVHAFFD